MRVLAAVLGWAARLRGPGTGIAVVYHRLGPRTGDPVRELLPAIALADFERQVVHMARRYRLVLASDLVPAAARRRRGARLPLAITFDDDEPGHLEHAAPVLLRHGAPATFFLCGGSLEAPRIYWWDHLQRLSDEGRLAEAALGRTLHEAAAAMEAMTATDRAETTRRLGELVADLPAGGLGAAEVAQLAARGFEIGFHTRDHDPLDTLDDAELHAALRDGRRELEAAATTPIRAVAYPHGHADARTAPAAAAAGYTTGFTTAGEPVRPTSDPRLIGRLEPRSPSLAVFALKLAAAHWRS